MESPHHAAVTGRTIATGIAASGRHSSLYYRGALLRIRKPDPVKIRLHRIWAVLPVPVVTVASMPGRLVGLCLGPFVIVRDDYSADWPTIVHELTHCKQFWRGMAILHLLRYYGSRRYRLKSEVEAFRAEIAACPAAERRQRLFDSARSLATSYSLGLDVDACRLLLEAAPGAMPNRWQPLAASDIIESVPTLVPARVERRMNIADRRRPRLAAARQPEHNRRRQLDRRHSPRPASTIDANTGPDPA